MSSRPSIRSRARRRNSVQGIPTGDTLILKEGVNGVPAGEYAILPARYALFGGYLVTPVSGTTYQQSGQPRVSRRTIWNCATAAASR